MPFLSLLDDRAKPKGSRDPLGFELVWTHFGRQVIGNLTTVTSSLDNFAVALLGFHWANELHAGLPATTKQAQLRKTFLRYEQLAAYLRYLSGDEAIMGITRVSSRLTDEHFKISLGLGAEQQILSDQASYGLWGLYSTAMRETGLVRGDERAPTALGESLTQQIEARLDKPGLLDLLNSKREISRKDLSHHAKRFRTAIRNPRTQKILLDALMKGSDSHGIQSEMWQITQQLHDNAVAIPDLPTFVRQVIAKTNNTDLQRRLREINAIERILVAANNIFRYCQRKDGVPLQDILGKLQNRYSYTHLPGDLDLTRVPRGDLIQAINQALRKDDLPGAMTQILELNKVVMEQRGGAPWVELERDGCLRVRVQRETGELHTQRTLETHWDYEYFLSSFLGIAAKALGASWIAR